MMKKRKIIAVTGARSEYDLMFSIYEKLNQRDDIDFSIIITGPHLSEKYGLTSEYIERDHFKISEKIYSLLDSDQKLARIASIGNQIPLLAQTLSREKPDIVLVAGDREEAISVCMTCAFMDIAVAHFFGGDIAKDGNIDNSVRYAASKFAHLHFTTLEEHKKNLLKLGEEDWRITVMGNPALDRFLAIETVSKNDVLKHFGISYDKNYCVLIQHSIITEVEEQRKRILITLEAIAESGYFCFINYPNSDAGSSEIIRAYDEYIMKYPKQFKVFKNLDRLQYVNLLRNADFLLGNSSSGLLEAPSLGLAAINIGSRQRGRVHGDNVIFVDNDKDQIVKAIDFVNTNEEYLEKVAKKQNPYGDGNSAEKAVEVLTSVEINKNLIYKNITY
ncbi:UDP-N-acetylglucosamine 2-epimerase [Marivirga arenosa]|uniref:UDP-N-acetylglucosamine 2-epimerase n=1 Tax=Marivirga arenosa TaxID=3059076 RepID=A0AA49GE13_9BACT|nr:UDP-N-acetylglucosamine 2-epimerase [Marivirga sp. BKB1-2]WKK80828.2 UDP-N-acetylglucosamine 2-epimerase [Marivirga sp. BKB1-2]